MHIILARKRFTTSTAFLDSCPNVLNCKKFFGSDNLSHDFQKISFPFYILLYYLWTQFLKVESNVAFFFFLKGGGGGDRRFHSELKKQDSIILLSYIFVAQKCKIKVCRGQHWNDFFLGSFYQKVFKLKLFQTFFLDFCFTKV